jgi:hypothetical protein
VTVKRSKAGRTAAAARWDSEERRARAVKRILDESPEHEISLGELQAQLKTNNPELGPWRESRIRGAVDWSMDKYRSPAKARVKWYLKFNKGGHSVRLVVTSGRHRRNRGFVGECMAAFGDRAMPRSLALKLGVPAARSAETFDVHSGMRNGKWSSPDMAVVLFRSARAKVPIAAHCFEIQERGVHSSHLNVPLEIAQSFVASQGFNRSWFMLHKQTWRELSQQEQQRVRRLAGRLGVGILAYGDPRRSTTWQLIHRARNLDYARSARATYLKLWREAAG